MITEDISLVLAFAAGLLSFFSPCVLPLIPSYFSILGGVGLEKNSFQSERNAVKPRLVLASAFFILGFSLVFIILGIFISATFSLTGGISVYINRAAGIIVIILGLNIIFDFLSFLNYEKRPFLRRWTRPGPVSRFRGMASAFIAGAAFAAGWTPCIGPVLTGILLMAGQSGKTGTAVMYLAVYSAGLALPFFLAALFFDFFLKHAAAFRSRLLLIRRISGILLIVIGIMILTGRYSALNILIQQQVFRYTDWAETKALPFRLLGRFLAWIQSF
jgi:cytochrome c-type biogenesis protein